MNITLSLPYDLTEQQWESVDRIFRAMNGWIGYATSDNTPQWFGTEGENSFICGSIEPSGLLLNAKLDTAQWIAWITVLCSRLTLELGIEIRDAEY